jgi:superfamily II DNA or RNA helicase
MRVDLLKPYQVEPAFHLAGVLPHRNAVDASDTGVGKTFVALAAAEHLKLRPLIVVPKVSVTSWVRAASLFGLPGFHVTGYDTLRTGRGIGGHWENTPPPGFRLEATAKCQSCQQEIDLDKLTNDCYTHPQGIHCIDLKKKPWDYGRFLWDLHSSTLLIFDEIHRCAAPDSLNARMLIAATAQQYRILGLSATLADSPLEMRAVGYMLRLHTLTGPQGFFPWASKHGCGRIEGIPGFHFKVGREKQKAVMGKIHTAIFPERGARLRKADIPGFPACSISSDLIDIPKHTEIDELYEEVRAALGRQEERAKLDKAPDMAITKMIRARQRIEMLKLPAVVELAEDYLAKGISLAVFVNFSETLQELRRRFAGQCVFLDGTQTDRERQEALDIFAADKARIMIANSQAGGESANMQDLRGEFPRGGLVMPPLSARILRQIFGRLPRVGAKSPSFYRVLLAAGTLEEKIKRNLDRNGGNMDYLNDGDLSPFEPQQ